MPKQNREFLKHFLHFSNPTDFDNATDQQLKDLEEIRQHCKGENKRREDIERVDKTHHFTGFFLNDNLYITQVEKLATPPAKAKQATKPKQTKKTTGKGSK